MKSLLIIPTIIAKENLINLQRMLSSIAFQKEEIGCIGAIIVHSEGDTLMMHSMLKDWEKSFPLAFILSEVKSTSRQRNLGIEYAKGKDVDFLVFLDDDLVFYPDCLKEVAKAWTRQSPITAALGFNIVNQPTMNSPAYFFKKIFLMGNDKRGGILKSGFGSPICPVEKDIDVQWMYSGASMWRFAIFQKFLFDEWYQDYGLGEDLDFSYDVSKKYRLCVCAKARVEHIASYVLTRNNIEMGKKQIINKFHFVCKHTEFSIVAFFWAVTGQCFENLFRFIANRKSIYAKRFWGNLFGIWFLALKKVKK